MIQRHIMFTEARIISRYTGAVEGVLPLAMRAFTRYVLKSARPDISKAAYGTSHIGDTATLSHKKSVKQNLYTILHGIEENDRWSSGTEKVID